MSFVEAGDVTGLKIAEAAVAASLMMLSKPASRKDALTEATTHLAGGCLMNSLAD